MSQKKKPAASTAQKKNSALLPLVVVLVVAVVLIVVLFARSNSLNSQLDAINSELTETNATLQQTVTDKEAVEDQLAAAQDSLREAQLTLEESTQKVTDLESQLATLTEENNANKATIAALTSDLETAKANKEAAEVYLANVEHSIQMALNALNGVTPAPTAEPTPEPTVEPEVEATPEVTAEPEATEAPAAEVAVTEEVTEEAPAAEETAEEAPAAEETTEEVVEEPVALPEVQYPIYNVTDEGTVVETEAAVVTYRLDENNAIAFLSATVNGEVVAEDVTALFLGKNRPLSAEDFTLDEAGVMQAIIDALNVNADSNG